MLEALSEGFAGRVAAVNARGFYVSDRSSNIFAVLGPGSWAGPLHLTVTGLHVPVSPQDRVSYSGGVLAAGRLAVRVAGCPAWSPRLPGRLAAAPSDWQAAMDCLDAGSGLARGGAVATDSVDTGSATAGGAVAIERIDAGLQTAWGAVTEAVRCGDLAGASRGLAGRGAGLTPSGDDVLAGILLVSAIDPRRRRSLSALARSASTTRLSRAFLRWAAQGQSIEPAHALLDAAATGDCARMRRGAQSLAGVGATSGRALIAGIALAALELPASMQPQSAVGAGASDPRSVAAARPGATTIGGRAESCRIGL